MTIENSRRLYARNPAPRMVQAQVAGQQMCWRFPLAVCGTGWLCRNSAQSIGEAEFPVRHDQLIVRSVIAAEGAHAQLD